MSIRIVTTTKKEIELTVKQLAEAFAHLSDDDQAEFFDEVAAAGDKFPTDGLWGSMAPDMQWHMAGAKVRRRGGRGEEVLGCMAAPIYLHTLRMWNPR